MSVESTNRLVFGARGARHRAPATVLVMVVAMLSALFIVGVAFLSTVTFEAKSIALETSEKRQSAVIGRLSGEVQSQLRKAFLGFDGKAWNQDVAPLPNQDIGNDRYGEIPGVHPLIASIDPYDPGGDGNFYFYQASDLELTRRSAPLHMAVQGMTSGVRLVDINRALDGDPLHPDNPAVDTDHLDAGHRGVFTSADFVETREGDTLLIATVDRPDEQLFRRDADGDGVWDSYQYRLSETRYSPAIRGDLTERLRAEDAYDDFYPYDPLDPNTDPDALYYAIRVIPHGGMVDVGHAHRTLLDEILGAEAEFVRNRYVPEGEEITLRRRFILPPRDTPLSKLQTYPGATPAASGEIYTALYLSFFNSSEWFNTPASPRWWPIDTGVDGADPDGNILGEWIPWIDALDVTGTDNYDIRHLLTTVSHDDQFMRMGRVPDAADDWIETILASEPDPDPLTPGNFSIDEWPSGDAHANVRGRLKVSLPGLVNLLVKESNDAGNPMISTIDDLVALSEANEYRERLIGTIHDAFMLMLRNVVDPDGDGDLTVGDPEDMEFRLSTPAALTANLIDFIDSDGEPTRVEIRDMLTGVGTNEYVYGLEAQPYITEIYRIDDGGMPFSAIELFNPYDVDINLAGYSLNDAEAGVSVPLTDEPLGGNTILAGEYMVLTSDPSGIAGAVQLGTAGSWILEGTAATSQVELTRLVDGQEVVLDRFTALASLDSNLAIGESQERVTGDTTLPSGEWKWQWLVDSPRARPAGAHTLGARNINTNPTDIRPVQIAFADDGTFSGNPGSHRLAAIPTTGTLLLLSQYANTKDDPFTAKLSGAGESRIDNGRMPVFDQSMKADPSTTPTPFTLGVPWGQLVFDYFTALPLRHTRNTDPNDVDADVNDMIPAIDQSGLRVHGRIDINSAPWRVLAGLPMVPMDDIPAAFRDKIANIIVPDDSALPEPIGSELAQSIVAYREARQIVDTVATPTTETTDFETVRTRADGGGNPFTGFLSVGELANVRQQPGGPNAGTNSILFDFDSGVVDGSNLEDYVEAVAVLVALGDWVTTRSHVFTIYGTLRGAGTKSAVDQRAIRFQETVDRLPCVFNNKAPRRVGPRVVGPYLQANLN